MNDITDPLISALRDLQSVVPCTVTIAGIDYPCTAADLVRSNLEFVQGGVFHLRNVTVNILKADLEEAPDENTPAVFGGENLRVRSVDGSSLQWHVLLVQEGA